MLFEKHSRHIGHTHRHAGVARVRSRDRVQRQCANGSGFFPVVRVGGAEGCNIQGDQILLAKNGVMLALRHTSPLPKIKRDG